MSVSCQYSQKAPEYLEDVIMRYGGGSYKGSDASNECLRYLFTLPISHIVDMYRYIHYGLSVSDPLWSSSFFIRSDLAVVMAFEFDRTF